MATRTCFCSRPIDPESDLVFTILPLHSSVDILQACLQGHRTYRVQIKLLSFSLSSIRSLSCLVLNCLLSLQLVNVLLVVYL